ncbi:hypothetical protein M408DRAFT_101853 [Serendipita vermifera MAFF 305830]|uniref:Uncharacterized protein n=1 Tax=Serendipita vermifera MAFF 305830 TaxID=933852 RepID=A0A0C2W5A9_SERVB|nr:hypothetical protein M408DRAFT_101853 [Serendipita vermifera MAFF 305830]
MTFCLTYLHWKSVKAPSTNWLAFGSVSYTICGATLQIMGKLSFGAPRSSLMPWPDRRMRYLDGGVKVGYGICSIRMY